MKKLKIHFTKMHGLGNDFIVINNLARNIDVTQIKISELSNRYTGIGFDQLLVIEPSTKANYFCRIYNADGSEARQCGNGLRCIARFMITNELHRSHDLSIETKAGIFSIQYQDTNLIRVNMGEPQIQNTNYPLELFLQPLTRTILPIDIISLGNPHVIVTLPTLATSSIEQYAAHIASDALFQNGVNIGFMQVLTRDQIALRTFERGSGETYACGSNACAAVVSGIVNGWLNNKVEVKYKHGSLIIEWLGGDHPIYMTGPAAFVYSGVVLCEQ